MNIGEQIPILQNGIVTTETWNKAARTLNMLRSMGVGPGMTMRVNGAGVFFDAVPASTSVQKLFPIGPQWTFGIEFEEADLINIYNPMLHKAGLTLADWIHDSASENSMPDQTAVAVTPVAADWAIAGNTARTIIYLKYDQADATYTLEASAHPKDAMTLPASDGAGTVDPMRYYLIPLYIVSATYTEADGSDPATFTSRKIYIDLIHGTFVLPLQM